MSLRFVGGLLLYLTSRRFPHTHLNSVDVIGYSLPHLGIEHFKYDLFCNVTIYLLTNLKIRKLTNFFAILT